MTIQTPQLHVIDGGEIAVRNDGPGNAGNLTLRAQSIALTNQGRISASTVSGTGGDITLFSDQLILRDHSFLVASAGGTGNGGSINLTAPVIVGLENSDIIANAVRGNGGNVKITTQGLFGLQYRDRLTPSNDITASSDFGINGNVQINTIGVNPANALNKLPGEVVDSSRQIADRCGAARTSSFVATGRGGIPKNPRRKLSIDRAWHDLRPLLTSANSSVIQPVLTSNPIDRIVEANAFQVDESGAIALVATHSTAPTLRSETCSPTINP